MTGVTSLSKNDANAVNQYNLAKYKLDNSSNSNIGSIIGGVGKLVPVAVDLWKETQGG
jgi:hypothetical protein